MTSCRSGSGSWELADTSVETELLLSRQPRGGGLEYRVFAVNRAGSSKPSALVALATVSLPSGGLSRRHYKGVAHARSNTLAQPLLEAEFPTTEDEMEFAERGSDSVEVECRFSSVVLGNSGVADRRHVSHRVVQHIAHQR